MSDGVGRDCGKLPIPLGVCPTCHHGIKPSRGWTWIDADELLVGAMCKFPVYFGEPHNEACNFCPLNMPLGRVGLLWIGEKFYPRPEDWIAEGHRMGFSRRISAVPKDFKLGETWVFAAHRKAISKPEFGNGVKFTPAVFHVFKPTRIEYVVKKKDSKKKLKALEKRGITLVDVVPVEDNQQTLS